MLELFPPAPELVDDEPESALLALAADAVDPPLSLDVVAPEALVRLSVL